MVFDDIFTLSDDGITTTFNPSRYSFRASYVKHEFELSGKTATLYHVATMNAAEDSPQYETFAEEIDARAFIVFKYRSYNFPDQLVDDQGFTLDEVRPVYELMRQEAAMSIITSQADHMYSFTGNYPERDPTDAEAEYEAGSELIERFKERGQTEKD